MATVKVLRVPESSLEIETQRWVDEGFRPVCMLQTVLSGNLGSSNRITVMLIRED